MWTHTCTIIHLYHVHIRVSLWRVKCHFVVRTHLITLLQPKPHPTRHTLTHPNSTPSRPTEPQYTPPTLLMNTSLPYPYYTYATSLRHPILYPKLLLSHPAPMPSPTLPSPTKFYPIHSCYTPPQPQPTPAILLHHTPLTPTSTTPNNHTPTTLDHTPHTLPHHNYANIHHTLQPTKPHKPGLTPTPSSTQMLSKSNPTTTTFRTHSTNPTPPHPSSATPPTITIPNPPDPYYTLLYPPYPNRTPPYTYLNTHTTQPWPPSHPSHKP